MQLQRIIGDNKKWIPQIDGLRFIAIFGVLFAHIFGQLLNSRGGYGFPAVMPYWGTIVQSLGRTITLFFVLSGYILAAPFARQYIDGGRPTSLKSFYLRRVTRLEPPYILCLLIYAAVRLVVFGKAHLFPALVVGLLYIHNFFQGIQPLNFPTWTLEIEIQFYLLVPLLAQVFRLPTVPRRLLLVTGIALSGLLNVTPSYNVGFYLPGFLCFFLTGFLLADLRYHLQNRLHKPWLDLVTLVTLATYFLMPEQSNRFLFSLVLGIFFTAALSGPVSRFVLGARPIAIIGGMCYSIYLMHMLFISGFWLLTRHALTHRGLGVDYLEQLILLLPIILGGSLLYYLLIERPCMDPTWPSRLAATLRGKSSVRAAEISQPN